jgi:hypothetical protein
MKKYFIVLLFILLPANVSFAEDFLGAPVVPNSQAVNKDDSRLTYTTPLSHEEVLAFYQEKLSTFENIKYRNWKDETYIEDDGRMDWHSIIISKEPTAEGTKVVISKDSWTWIIGTLILRYIAVFVVLMVLFVGMKISGSIISSSVNKAEAKKA